MKLTPDKDSFCKFFNFSFITNLILLPKPQLQIQ